MADDQEIKEEPYNGYFDESLIDPRLRPNIIAETYGKEYQTGSSTPTLSLGSTLVSDTGLAPIAATPLTPTQFELYDFNVDSIDMGFEREAALPPSAYQSLDFIVGSDDMVHDETERLWLIGVQAGIGLGITGAREAVLNEMTYENTVFSRPIQSYPSDPSPYEMRMYLGQRCLTGFDRRVADRIAKQFVASSMDLIDIIVENGLTACLPEYGSPLPGTFAFFTDEDSARCHENSRNIDEALKLAGIQPQPKPNSMVNGDNIEQPTPLTASFEGDSRFIGGLDMTQLTGTAALVANALNERNRAKYGSHVTPNQQYTSRRPGLAPYVSHLTEDGLMGNGNQGYENKHDNSPETIKDEHEAETEA
ncbi:hypothetical protein EV127DRAFT_479676 [Xylaria flabelliformis]|nr:hypothetical protein EV127DRAFT_479676 [Xylaria flabelliformis]